LTFNGQKNYRELFNKETAEIDNQEMWRAGKTVRSLRPENNKSDQI
jgi:ketol-acid reductoisomerase